MTYACAIAPLDQSTTSIGWQPGLYQRDPCGLSDCAWQDNSVQFLADPGTPMVAPFPVEVVSTRPFVLRATVVLPFLGDPYDFLIRGADPAVAAGARLEKGALLGRVAARERGVTWALYGSDPVFHRVGTQPFIMSLFTGLGLEVVGSGDRDMPGFRRTPRFGGQLLARSAGPAGAACALPSAVHGLASLERYFDLASAAPTGFVDPDTSVYARYGTSSQTDTSPPRPHQNVSPAAAGAGAGLLLAVAAALGAWWYARSDR